MPVPLQSSSAEPGLVSQGASASASEFTLHGSVPALPGAERSKGAAMRLTANAGLQQRQAYSKTGLQQCRLCIKDRVTAMQAYSKTSLGKTRLAAMHAARWRSALALPSGSFSRRL